MTVAVAAGLRQVRFTQAERQFVYGVALKYLKDADAAQEVAQDALLLAFRYRHSYLGKARFTTWLYRIAATSALMYLRRARRRQSTMLLSLNQERYQPETGAGQRSPEELCAASETMALCERVAAEMGPGYQPLFRLRFVDGFSDAEVGQRLGLRDTTVKTRAYRARTHVRERLAQVSGG